MGSSNRADSSRGSFRFVRYAVLLCILLGGMRLWSGGTLSPGDWVDCLKVLTSRRLQAQARLSTYVDQGKPDEVAAILKTYPDLVNARYVGQTPLQDAASFGQPGVVAVLIRHGADVNAKDEFGFTPLMNAVMKQNGDIVRQLVAAGAHINVFDNDNHTALHHAVTGTVDGLTEGDLDMVKLLMKLGADVNACRAGGETPLSTALDSGFPPWDAKGTPSARAIVAYLKRHGARMK